jgi:hypothetical protein
MTIETKFNTGDEVWAHLDEQCMKGKVVNITIYIKRNDSVEGWYNVMFDDDDVCLPSTHLFPSKEELLKSL